MTILFLTLMAPADATTLRGQPGDAAVIHSPFGDLTRGTARRICLSEFVFIGTVEDSLSRWLTLSDGRRIPQTDLTLEVERVLYGTPGAFFPLTIPGGRFDEVAIPPPRAFPRPVIGLRYLVAASTLKLDVAHRSAGDTLLNEAFQISADAQLPPSNALSGQLDALCTANGLPRYHDAKSSVDAQAP